MGHITFEYPSWKGAGSMAQPECENVTLDEFDSRLKELLKEAADSGIVVETVLPEYMQMISGESTLMSVRVEYRKRGGT